MEIAVVQEVKFDPLTATDAVVDSMDKAALMAMIQSLQGAFA